MAAEKGCTVKFTDMWIDSRTLTDEEAEKLLFAPDENGDLKFNPHQAYRDAMTDPEFKTKVETKGRAGIEISDKVKGDVTLSFYTNPKNTATQQKCQVYGGNQRAGIEKNNGAHKLTIEIAGRLSVYAGLGSYETYSGPAAIGSQAGQDVDNIEIKANVDRNNPGDLNATASTDVRATTNDFGAAIGSGSGAKATRIVLTGPDYDYYDENSDAMFVNLKGTACQGSAIGAGYNSQGESSVTIKGGAVNAMSFGYAAIGAAVGVSVHNYQDLKTQPKYDQASCVVRVEGGYLNPQSYRGPGIMCGSAGTYTQTDGILHVDGGYMSDFYDYDTRDYAYGVYAKTVDIGSGMKEEELEKGHDWLGYINSDTSYGIVALDSMTFDKGMMNVYGSDYTPLVKNAQGIYTSKLEVKGGDLYSNSGILLKDNGELTQTGGILTSISARGTGMDTYLGEHQEATPQKAGIGVDIVNGRKGTANITISGGAKCETLGGFDVGGGTITVNDGTTYVRAITGQRVGASNESIFLDCFSAGDITINNGKVIAYIDDGANRTRPTSVGESTDNHGVSMRPLERNSFIAENEDGEDVVVAEPRAKSDSPASGYSASDLGTLSSSTNAAFSVKPTFSRTYDHTVQGSNDPGGTKQTIDENSDGWINYDWVEIGPRVALTLKEGGDQTVSLSEVTHNFGGTDVVQRSPYNATVSFSSSDNEVLSFDAENSGVATLHHAGEVDVTVSPAGNYLGNTVKFHVKIGKMALNDGEVVLSDTWTFGDPTPTPSFKSKVISEDDYAITYSYAPRNKKNEANAYQAWDGAFIPAGEYTVKASVPESADYGKSEITKDFSVTQATGKIMPTRDKVYVVNGGQATITIPVKGDGELTATVDGGVASVTTSRQDSTLHGKDNGTDYWNLTINPTTTGTGNITLKLASCTNFIGAEKTIKVEVGDSVRTVQVPKGATHTFDGTTKKGFTYQNTSNNDSSFNHLIIEGVTEATEPGTYEAKFTPENGYEWPGGGSEQKAVTWTIQGQPMVNCTITLSANSMKYTGAQLKPSVSVRWSAQGKTPIDLVEGTDYSVTYGDNIQVGSGSVTVTSKTNKFSGSKQTSFTIAKGDISDSTTTPHSLSPAEPTYCGSQITPTFTARDSAGKTLVQDVDYTLEWVDANGNPDPSGRVNIGLHRVNITGKGNYEGSKFYMSLRIHQADMKDLVVDGVKAVQAGGAVDQNAITVKDANGNVIPKSDYTITASSTDKAGTGTITVKGNATDKDHGNVTGTKTVEFPIYEAGNKPTVIAVPTAKKNLVYNGQEQVGVPEGDNYTLLVKDPFDPETADLDDNQVAKSVKPGDFTVWATPNEGYAWDNNGDVSPKRIDWSMAAINLAEAELKGVLESAVYADSVDGESQGVGQNVKVFYNGTEVNPELEIEDENLKGTRIFEVAYENNTSVGQATLTVKPAPYYREGQGYYERYNPYVTGSQSATFNITKADASISSSVFISAQIKDGRSLGSELPVTVRTDGEVTVSSDNTKIAEVSIRDADQSGSSPAQAQSIEPLELGFEGVKANKVVTVKPRKRGSTTIHVVAGDGQNYKAAEQTIYVNVFETASGKTLVDKPVELHLPYTGAEQVGVVYDANAMTLEGTYKAAANGTYEATAKLKAGYAWADKSAEDIHLTWSIGTTEEGTKANLLTAVDENGSIISSSLDATLDLAKESDSKSYRFTYPEDATLSVENTQPDVANVDAQSLTKGDDGYYHLTVTPNAVGSTLITVKAPASDETTPTVTFYVTVIKSEVSGSTVPVPMNKTYSYTGSLFTGIEKAEGYTLSGPSVNAEGESVGLNAGTYYVTATLDEGKAWAGLNGNSDPRTIAWTIKPVELSSAVISGVSDFTADGKAHYQDNLKLEYRGKEVNPAEYTITYGDADGANAQATPPTSEGTHTVIVTANNSRNFTGSISRTYTISKAEPAVAKDETTPSGTGTQATNLQPQGDAYEGITIDLPEGATNDELVSEQYYLGPFADNSGATTAPSTGTDTSGTTGTTSSGTAQRTPSGANLFATWKALEGDLEEGKRELTTVAIIDTGCLMNHPDLMDNLDMDNAKDTYHDNYPVGANYMVDAGGHGTHVAGIIAATANNGRGTAGTSYNCQILPIRVFDDYGGATSEDIFQAYDYIEKLIEKGRTDIKVVNMSLGGYDWDTEDDSYDQLLLGKITELRNKYNVLTLAAGGNGDAAGNPIQAMCFPSDLPNVLSVTSLNEYGSDSTWSDYNVYKDVSAPGERIVSTYLGKNYAELSGTSMATPLVSGIAALLYSVTPGASADDVETAIVTGGHKLTSRGKRTLILNGEQQYKNSRKYPVLAVDAYLAYQKLQEEYGGAKHFMSECEVQVDEIQYFEGKAIEPDFKVINTTITDGDNVVDPSQYEVKYENNAKVGTATIIVTGKKGAQNDESCQYRGTLRKTFEIKYNLGAHGSIASIEKVNSPAAGGKVEPTPTVTYEGQVLVAGRDYTVTYENNTSDGVATVIVTGKGDYAGTLTREFKIGEGGQVQIPKAIEGLVYNGQVQTGVPESTSGSYTITGNTATDAKDEYIATLKLVDKEATWSDGKQDEKTVKWSIAPATPKLDASPSTIVLGMGDVSAESTISYGGTSTTLTAKSDKPEVATVASESITDGKVVVKPGTVAGEATLTITAEADGNYTSNTTQIHVYVGDTQATPTTTLPTGSVELEYAGRPLTAVLAGDGYQLTGGDGVVVADGNATVEGVGEYKVTATPIDYAKVSDGMFTSEALESEKAQEITVKVKPVSAERLTVESIPNQTYAGEAFQPVPVVKFKNDMADLVPGTDFVASYSNNQNAGTGNVTLDFGTDGAPKTNYFGKLESTFTIDKATRELTAPDSIVVSLTENLNKQVPYDITYSDDVALELGTDELDGIAEVSLDKSGDGGAYQLKVEPKKAGQGSLTITAPANDSNHVENVATVSLTVTQKTVAEPKANQNLIYDGNEQIGVPHGDGYTLSIEGTSEAGASINADGDAVATNASYESGTYKVLATLDPGVGWEDGTVDAKHLTFSVKKAESTLQLSKSTVNLNPSATTTVNVTTTNKDSVWLGESDNEGVATATFDTEKSVITVTAGATEGTAHIQVNSNGDINHNGVTAQLTVVVAKPAPVNPPNPPSGGGGGGSTTPTPGGGESGTTPEPETPPTDAETVQQDVIGSDVVSAVNKDAGNVAKVEPAATPGATKEDSGDVTWTITITDENATSKDVADGPVEGIVKALRTNAKATKAVLMGNPNISINLQNATTSQIEKFCQDCINDTLKKVASAQANDAPDASVADELDGSSFKLIVTCADGSEATHTLRFKAPGSSTTPVNSIPVYRLYNQWSNEHMFTLDKGEKDRLISGGWTYEGIAWRAPTTGNKPVYRLFNKWTKEHFYAPTPQERDNLVTGGWTYEGVAWHSAASNGQAIYRLYNQWNPGISAHHYASKKSEFDELVGYGWEGEGIAWYGVPSASK